MRAFLIATVGFVLFVVAVKLFATDDAKAKAGSAPTASAPLTGSEDDKALYALGVAVSQNIVSFEFTPAELEKVKQGFTDGALGKTPQVDVQSYFSRLREMQQTRIAATAQKTLDKQAAEPGAKRMESGLIITTVKEGSGPTPKATDTVKVHYHGTLPNGKVFDSSVERGEPATFPLNGVIPCWTEGVQQIKVGGKSKLVCPASIAYGDRGAPPDIGPGATLIFDVELLGIENAPAAQ
ncbi:FKBP-type peptidyl-prolyl cis-trans isomerase [Steroidobacter sp. S1-65]|uniref:Peptidyl-prolyl cis-trans isomerase n=1 Tax=Steroidobacter gossypii TaxID=2805490 RepID=A0ABS1X2N0_9GAMM|nr:FKBP-type peptidyl-prolyl cis-trans isomerase [Steroidobacter gossypii]MBM0107477.1 FKBP-type peptidyl-prolyl cis-trans isomerase [Steroidobacter gossypii]